MEIGIIKRLLILIVALLAVIAVSYRIGRRDGLIQATENSMQMVDTLVVCDTITQEKPIYVDRIKLQKVLVPVPVHDTIRIHDTLYLNLDREQVMWQDSMSRVYASGIMPHVDSVQHFIKEMIVTKEVTIPVKKPCRWGIGLQAGYGAFAKNGQITASPYVGVGLSYNLFSW